MKRCVFCGTENDDSAKVCVKCHNQLPDRPDGEEQRTYGFSGDPDRDSAESGTPDFQAQPQPAGSASAAEVPDRDGTAPAAAPTDAPQSGETVLSSGDGGQTAEEPAEQVPQSGFVPAGDAASKQAASGTAPADSADRAAAGAGIDASAAEVYGPENGTYAGRAREAAEDSFGGQPEGTASGRIPPREQGSAPADFGVGRGQTYGARQQYEAQGGRYEVPGRGQYGSAGYGYRQAPEEAAQGRSDYARVNAAVGSKTILFRSRKMVKGFGFFLLALAFTAMIATNFCNIALPGTMDPQVSNAYYNLTNLDSSLETILGGTNGFGTQLLSELAKQLVSEVVNVNGIIRQLGTSVKLSILLIFAVPNVLYALALWIMFIQTKRNRAKFGMGGYTLARVMMILKFVVACLVLAVGLIISVYFVVVGASSARFTSSFIQGLFMLIVMIVIAIFTIMYYVQWIYMLKCAKVNVRSGIDIGRAPMYIGVISIILALLCAAMLLPLSPDDYLGIAAGGTKALYFLVSGIWVLVYRRTVRRASALNG